VKSSFLPSSIEASPKMPAKRTGFKPWSWRKSKTGFKSTSTKSDQYSRDIISTYNSEIPSRLDTASVPTRPRTRPAVRPRTGISTVNNQELICAINESRGVTPVVGIAILNLHTCEVLLTQINDNSTYNRTVQKLGVYQPQLIIFPDDSNSAANELYLRIEEEFEDVSRIEPLHRQYFTEVSGLELIQQLAGEGDFEAMKASVSSIYFAVCCFAAVRPTSDGRLLLI
jgi:DNA mismatch repair protein MSH4